MKTTKVGDVAPDVTLQTHDGQTVALKDYQGKQAVVLFFYPKDGTAICTKEACEFRDAFEDFVSAGAVVIGVSSDSDESHQQFAQQLKLPFLLVSDQEKSLRKAFGVPKTLGLLPGRVTYVIDCEGIIRMIFRSQFSAGQHVSEALSVIKQLSA